MTEEATTKVSSRGQIVIPVGMRKNFVVGEELLIIRQGEDLLIKKQKKVVMVLADEKLLAEDSLSPEDEEAWKDL